MQPDEVVSSAIAIDTRSAVDLELERLHAASYAWALTCCRGNRDHAEEVLQMTYLKIIEGKARFEGRSQFKTWLFGVIRHTALEQLRWRTIRERLMEAFSRRTVPVAGEEATANAESVQRRERLLAALGALPRRQREVIELVFYHEMTVAEAATTVGVSVGTASVHYARAKKNLAARLRGIFR
jgi:RNA polymerase sigma factor (sigma-70 family)